MGRNLLQTNVIRPRTFLAALLLIPLISACDYFATQDLKPGVSTGADVRKYLGRPNMIWDNADGSVTLEYSRQPQGIHCYMATLETNGQLRQLEQVLTEKTFATIPTGMPKAMARRALCEPASKERMERQGEEVWSWLIDNTRATEKVYFLVHFDARDQVLRTSRNTEYSGR